MSMHVGCLVYACNIYAINSRSYSVVGTGEGSGIVYAIVARGSGW